MPQGYPAFLDLTNRRIVLIGAGPVAVRKAKGVLEFGAREVRAVAPQFHPDMPEAVEKILARYDAGHLDGAGLVFACTNDPAVNAAVVRDALDKGLWVHRADVDGETPGNFITPAWHRQGPTLLAVSSGGSPRLSAKMRDQLAGHLDPRLLDMARAMESLRPQLRNRTGLSPEQRRRVFQWLCEEEALGLLHREGPEGLMAWLRSRGML